MWVRGRGVKCIALWLRVELLVGVCVEDMLSINERLICHVGEGETGGVQCIVVEWNNECVWRTC